MSIATKKLSLIERLMKVNKEGVLDTMEDLLIQAEMESRTVDSLNAINKDETISLDQFAQENKAWLKKRSTK